jgi:MacB-like periplasmic core domain
MNAITVVRAGISSAVFTLTLTSCESVAIDYSPTGVHLDSTRISVEIPATDVGGASVAPAFFGEERPFLGRFFVAADYQANGRGVAVLSHDIWVGHFRSLPGVVGSQLVVNGGSVTVVGIARPGFGHSGAGLVWFPN